MASILEDNTIDVILPEISAISFGLSRVSLTKRSTKEA